MDYCFEGIVVPVVTPFDKKGGVDIGALDVILEFLIGHGVHGIMPLGSQGEFYALSPGEKRTVIDAVIKCINRRKFVIVHVGEIATQACIDLAQHAEVAGADAIAVITPFFITPSQQELTDHYKQICEAVSLPVFAYNNPDRSGVNLLPKTIANLANQVTNFVGIKDSSGDLAQTAAYIRCCPEDFCTFIGRDSLIYGGLLYGAVGAVAATANVVPDLVVGIYHAFRSGNLEEARQLQATLAPLREAFALGTFPGIVKDAMNLIGLPVGEPRRPIQSLQDQEKDELKAILAAINQFPSGN
jgi:4-hydroxy-tetrahydrodipicolinate synthase